MAPRSKGKGPPRPRRKETLEENRARWEARYSVKPGYERWKLYGTASFLFCQPFSLEENNKTKLGKKKRAKRSTIQVIESPKGKFNFMQHHGTEHPIRRSE
jgi:hypothetical protein